MTESRLQHSVGRKAVGNQLVAATQVHQPWVALHNSLIKVVGAFKLDLDTLVPCCSMSVCSNSLG